MPCKFIFFGNICSHNTFHARIQEFSSGGGGIQVNLTKKGLTALFFCFCFFSPQLIYRSQIVTFKENYHFSRFMRGSNIFQGWGGPTFSRGGPTFSRGGGNCLFPIETHITGGPDPLPPPPPGSALAFCSQTFSHISNVNFSFM